MDTSARWHESTNARYTVVTHDTELAYRCRDLRCQLARKQSEHNPISPLRAGTVYDYTPLTVTLTQTVVLSVVTDQHIKHHASCINSVSGSRLSTLRGLRPCAGCSSELRVTRVTSSALPQMRCSALGSGYTGRKRARLHAPRRTYTPRPNRTPPHISASASPCPHHSGRAAPGLQRAACEGRRTSPNQTTR